MRKRKAGEPHKGWKKAAKGLRKPKQETDMESDDLNDIANNMVNAILEHVGKPKNEDYSLYVIAHDALVHAYQKGWREGSGALGQ